MQSSSSTNETTNTTTTPLTLTIKINDLIDPNTKSFTNQSSEILKNKKFDILQIEDLEENLAPEVLHSLKESINDNGNLILLFSENFKNENNSMFKSVSSLKFAGYTETKIETTNNNVFKLSGKKRKTKAASKKNSNSNSNATTTENPWKNINLNVQSDLVLEDELVDPFDSYQKFAKKTDCVTKPKPCKNCNCGRAEKEAGNGQVSSSVNSSSCGRCYLGDAFRCAGCPYKGKPAFEPGDKIDFSNVNGNENSGEAQALLEAEEVSVKVGNANKVKIDL